MEIIQVYRNKASIIRAEANLAKTKADRWSKLIAARELETMAREIEVVFGLNGESCIDDWLDERPRQSSEKSGERTSAL